jgi:hypothetical protein
MGRNNEKHSLTLLFCCDCEPNWHLLLLPHLGIKLHISQNVRTIIVKATNRWGRGATSDSISTLNMMVQDPTEVFHPLVIGARSCSERV